MPTVKSCGLLILRGNPVDSFLLMKHSDRWDLPKGHVDGNETELECAMREVWEETGIGAEALELDSDFRFTHEYPVWLKRYGGERCNKTLVIFLARLLKDQPIALTEHEGFQWFPWEPPHQIQEQTIDPLLAEVAEYLAE